MLRSLGVRDLLIIDRLDLNFEPGLNVMTGETGAGKSILLDALGFVLGWRGRAELVRSGAAQAEVTAVFDLSPDHAALGVLQEAGLAQDDELILRRVNTPDGRKTAWVNDRRVSGDVLRRLSDTLVELHGQHDDKGLLDVKGHRLLLDQFGGLGPKLEKLAQLWRNRSKAQKALSSRQEALKALKEEEDFLRHAADELQAMGARAGEAAELDSRRRLMQAAERIQTDVARAAAALSSQGAEGLITDAMRWLEEAASEAEGALDPALESIVRALSELGDAQQRIEQARDLLSHDPMALEETEERLFAIRALARKHDVQPDELETLAETFLQKIALMDQGADDLAQLEADLKKAEAAFSKAADEVTQLRRAAAQALDKAMAEELAPLKMERAVFTTTLTEAAPGPTGQDDVAFRVATNPGAPSGALNKIASGGELSRFLLALKVCLTKETSGLTMIFDEIDRGVGGATADAVGRRLSELAAQGQVLVVTHSPQVAALGGHHMKVEKRVENSETLSTVTALSPGARVDEIARMVAGDRITDEARGAARALLGV
ncbi:MAG: DNA repair protein RecN [Pseudomonadota bacterium]